jgi:hypothetical protein
MAMNDIRLITSVLLLLCPVLLLAASDSPQLCSDSLPRLKPDAIYTDNLDGTVSDNETGLMWQKCSEGLIWTSGINLFNGSDDACLGEFSLMSWRDTFEAAALANSQNKHGYDDWRVPNYKEGESLIERACAWHSMNSDIFIDMELVSSAYSRFWTSTPLNFQLSASNGAVLIQYNIGYITSVIKSTELQVRLVRTIK